MSTTQRDPRPSLVRRCFRWLARLGLFVLSCLAVYLLIALIGLIPVNNDFHPAPDGVEIWFVSNPIHTDIILPAQVGATDWLKRLPVGSFAVDSRQATHVAIGWGNKDFYINTPTWGDLRLSTVGRALFWPSESCMHVTLCTTEGIPQDARSVKISAAQYQRLAEYIDSGFRHQRNGHAMLIRRAAYGPADAFFEGEGRYHCFNTCNCWTGGAFACRRHPHRLVHAAARRSACLSAELRTRRKYSAIRVFVRWFEDADGTARGT